ncbi:MULTISPECIES: FAD-dependent oxidoreductase [Janibacter]|uniref:FAD-dependent oxidoreductase n=1 Tax=Janibacter TaxID=53457 RepID=UPI00082BCEFB|nr:FAD-dependent oxidoreductase [Janibacter terrae]
MGVAPGEPQADVLPLSVRQLELSGSDDPRVIDDQRHDDYANHVVPITMRLGKWQLAMSFWSLLSAMVWLFYGALASSLFGSVNAIIAMVLAVVTYSVGTAVFSPVLNEDRSFPLELTRRPREVAVVGGGVAGMRSAALLHDRGHRVTLFEPEGLGGVLRFTRHWESKVDLRALVDHLEHEVVRRGIPVVTQRAGVDELESFETVVLATGAQDREAGPEVAPGVTTTTPASVRPEDVGSSVVVVGGGFQGCECALRIARELPGASVTLVEQGDALQQGDEVFTDLMALPRLLVEAGVDVRTGTRATVVTATGVELAAGSTLTADTVVLALGRRRADNPLRPVLEDRGQQVVVVGSADRPGRVFDAIHTAFFAGRQL